MSKKISANKASSAKTKLSKQGGKWVASDPTSLETVLARLKQAKSWSQGQEALIIIFSALLAEQSETTGASTASDTFGASETTSAG